MAEGVVRLVIDGRQVAAGAGQTVLEAARQHGIEIPTLCYHPDLSPVGSCRLCVVEVEGMHALPAACTLIAAEGMRVQTESEALTASRRGVLELLLSRYRDDGPALGDRQETEFLRWVERYGARYARDEGQSPRYVIDSDPNPFVWVDLNKCILCTRCVRACAEVQGRFVWSVGGRGDEARIVAGADTTMLDARCESCGACVAYCPTGALDDKPSVGLGQAERVTSTVCAYCGVGCTVDLNVRDNRIIRVTSRPEAPVNGQSLCVKGRYGYGFVHHPDRLARPRVRAWLLEGGRRPANERGPWVETDWDTALAIAAARLHETKAAWGADAIGLLSSAKCTNEENYLVQKLARQVIGTHNVDHCARLCHSSTVAGLSLAYGSGAMSNTMQDVVRQARAMFIIGSNVTEQHPVFGAMIRQAVLQRGMKLVVADPRKIEIAEFAALYLRHRPGTDVALLNGLMHEILRRGWHDRRFVADRTEGFDEFRAAVEQYPVRRAAEICGVAEEDLTRAAELLATNRPMAAVWAMGITQHTTGVLNVLALANLQMLLGNVGVPGGGVNPLRGQNNVQGACDMGALPNVFPGYRSVADPHVRARFATAWATQAADGSTSQEASLSESGGLTVTELIDGAGQGRIRALYILGENPAMTDPDLNRVRACLTACDFIVLQEIFPSETSHYADVLLPGVAWAEKYGTVTNTERRVQLMRQAIAPSPDARQDWWITSELARRLLELEGRTPTGPQAAWNYGHPGEIMEEIAALTPSYGGVSHQRLARGDALHWPIADAAHSGTPILHVERFTRGLGKFHPTEHLPPSERPDEEYPLVLTTGRVLYHWHGGEMTRRTPELNQICPEALVELSSDDARRAGIGGAGQGGLPWVRVVSRRGQLVARAVITERVAEGLVFANFHFPGEQNANNLTIAALDPLAKIPEYKVCAVRIEPANP